MTDLQGQLGQGASGGSGAGDMALRAMVGNKDPILQSVGMLTPGSRLYYTLKNSTVDLPEVKERLGDSIISPASRRFGSTQTYTISNNSFVQNIWLQLRLPDAGGANWGGSFNPVGVNEGWGYSCIESIQYNLGNSSIPNITLSGYGNFMLMAATSPDDNVTQAMIERGGNAWAVYNNGSYSNTPEEREATVFLRLPNTSMTQAIPIDTTVLNNTWTITVKFRPLEDWWWGYTASCLNPNFEVADMVLRQFTLSNPAQGLRNAVRFNASDFITLPFQSHTEYEQSVKVVQSDFNTSPTSVAQASVNIQNFVSADLTVMYVMFIRDIDHHNNIDLSTYTTNNMAAPKWGTADKRKALCIGSPVRDFELVLNGQTIVYYPGDSMEAMNQPMHKGVKGITIQAIDAFPSAGERAQFVEDENYSRYTSVIYKIMLAQENPFQPEGLRLQNTPRYTNMSMTLRFRPSGWIGDGDVYTYDMTRPEFVASGTAEETYHVKILQCYNSVFKLGENFGSSSLLMN